MRRAIRPTRTGVTSCLCLAVLLSGCGAGQDPAPGLSDFQAPPQRVVVIGPSTAETMIWLGLGSALVGVSDFCSDPHAASLPRVGGQLDPNLELIAALDPDLVMVQGSLPTVHAWCTDRGVAFRPWKTQSVAAWREEVRGIAALFRIEQQADLKLQEFDAELDELRPPGTSRLRTLIVVSRKEEQIAGLLVAGGGSFLNELLHLAGGINVYADQARDYFDLSEEALLEVRPEVVLELGGEGDDELRTALWQRDFPTVPAAANRRVHGLRQPWVFLPGPRMLDSVRLMRARLHTP